MNCSSSSLPASCLGSKTGSSPNCRSMSLGFDFTRQPAPHLVYGRRRCSGLPVPSPFGCDFVAPKAAVPLLSAVRGLAPPRSEKNVIVPSLPESPLCASIPLGTSLLAGPLRPEILRHIRRAVSLPSAPNEPSTSTMPPIVPPRRGRSVVLSRLPESPLLAPIPLGHRGPSPISTHNLFPRRCLGTERGTAARPPYFFRSRYARQGTK